MANDTTDVSNVEQVVVLHREKRCSNRIFNVPRCNETCFVAIIKYAGIIFRALRGCTFKACPHLNRIRSTSISHLNPLRTKPDQSIWITSALQLNSLRLCTGLVIVHVNGRAFFNKSSSSAEVLFGCFCIRCDVFAKKKTTKSFGAGTFDHKESRKETEAASGSEKAAKYKHAFSLERTIRSAVPHSKDRSIFSTTAFFQRSKLSRDNSISGGNILPIQIQSTYQRWIISITIRST